jgi:hypothetical protein
VFEVGRMVLSDTLDSRFGEHLFIPGFKVLVEI